MTKYVLDTNYLQSLFDETDVNSEKAAEILEALEEQAQMIIPQIVVAELLIGKDSTSVIRNCKELVTDFEKNNDDDLKFISKIPYQKRKRLKANDCLVMAITKRNSAKLITFDKVLEKYTNV